LNISRNPWASRTWIVLGGLLLAAAGFIIGFSWTSVKAWSLVIVEQEAGTGEAIDVPGVAYQVTYGVVTMGDLSEPRGDVLIRPVGCGKTLIQTPLLIGASQVVFSVAWDSLLPQPARRCRDGTPVVEQAEARRATTLAVFRPAFEYGLERWRALDEDSRAGGEGD